MPLPASWVDALFAKLGLRYGAAFARQWLDADLAAVKADWGDVLDGQTGGAIAHALHHLTAAPPNAIQFRDLCRLATRDERQPTPIALPAPKADAGLVAALVATVRRDRVRDPLAWARALREREGRETVHTSPRDRLTTYQREAWRVALNEHSTEDATA